MKYNRTLIFLLCALGAVSAASYMWMQPGAIEPSPEASATPTIELSPEELPEVGESITKDGYTITNEGIEESGGVATVPVPDYTTIPKRPSAMPAESYAQVVEKMKDVIEMVTKQIEESQKTRSTNLATDAWLDIALYRNMLGDSSGAEAIWKYLVQVSPGLIQPYGNLGNLYMVRQNFAESETWYLQAIEKMPNALQYYADLADIYAAQKRDADYVKILEKGIAADAKPWNLQVTLGRYYNQKGDIKNAHIQFNAALARAKKAGNTAAVDAIEQEKIYTQ